MTPSEYNKALMTTWRKQYLPLLLAQEDKVIDVFQAVQADLSRLILENAGKDGTIRYKRWTQMRAQTHKMLDNMARDYTALVRDNMFRSAEEMASAMTEITSKYISTWDARIQDSLAINFSLIPTDAVMAAITKPVFGYTFSERVWNLAEVTQEELERIISTGIARGRSALDMARELKAFVLGGRSLSDVERMAIGVKGRNISYEALRLARTEINNAYWDAHELAAEQSPVVKGLKWNLSATHHQRVPKGDICDEYAKQNKYGLGRGVFKVGTVPRKHPNCLCYLTDELWSERELNRIMKAAA